LILPLFALEKAPAFLPALPAMPHKMDYSQLPGEKVELIRNIASEITKK
jgi:hypothetical protein